MLNIGFCYLNEFWDESLDGPLTVRGPNVPNGDSVVLKLSFPVVYLDQLRINNSYNV